MVERVSVSNDARLKRAIWIAAAVLVVLIIAFAAYYYWDRYVGPKGGTAASQSTLQGLEVKVRTDPKNADARLALAESYLMDSRFDEALAQATQVMNAYPEKDRALLIVGVAYSFKSEPAKAVEPLQAFAKIHDKGEMAGLDTSLEAALYYLAQSYIQLDRPAEAIKPLLRALEINRTDADALCQLGLAYAATGKHGQAIEQYTKAAALVPDFGEVYAGMAESYEELHKSDLAKYAHAMVAYSAKDYQSARSQLTAVVAADPNLGEAQFGLGLANEQLGETKKARDGLQKALRLMPGNLAVEQALGRVNTALAQ